MQPTGGFQQRIYFVTSGIRNLRARRENAERRDETETRVAARPIPCAPSYKRVWTDARYSTTGKWAMSGG